MSFIKQVLVNGWRMSQATAQASVRNHEKAGCVTYILVFSRNISALPTVLKINCQVLEPFYYVSKVRIVVSIQSRPSDITQPWRKEVIMRAIEGKEIIK